jgi:hypothetical protein
MELPYETGGLMGPAIGALFGMDYGVVRKERKRCREKAVTGCRW